MALIAGSAGPAPAATNLVTSLGDGGPGSLRQVIAGSASGDTVMFGVTGTCELSFGELVVTQNLIIRGPGASVLSISGAHQSRVFDITARASVSISDLTIADGWAEGDGGGVYSDGVLTLSNCCIIDNLAAPGNNGSGSYYYGEGGGNGGSGGGVRGGAETVCINCEIDNNSAGNGGSGGYGQMVAGSGGVGGSGGGVVTAGNLVMYGCTVSGNRAGHGGSGGPAFYMGGQGGNGGDGGGLDVSGQLALTNCTVINNSCGAGGASGWTWADGGRGGDGGGIHDATGNGVLVACTVAGNVTGVGNGGRDGIGGGICGVYIGPTLLNDIVAQNSGDAPDIAGTFLSLGHNLIGVMENTGLLAPGDLVGSGTAPLDPKLDGGENGGPTWTMALLPGSPAINAGSVEGAPATDQRGVARPQGPGVDIGAFEVRYPVFTALTFDKAMRCRLQMGGLEPNRPFTLLSSSDFANWTAVSNFVSGTNCEFECFDPLVVPARFYRLQYGPR